MEHAAAHETTGREPRSALYVVATPIGNLRDISQRALDVLKQVDAVLAEDTRVTSRLLGHFGITKQLIPVHEHNEQRASERVLALLASGKSLALACDAGTPAVSDPGALLVAAARASGYTVTPIPGPNAAVTAMSVAGFTAPHFLFYGFLPARPAARRRELAGLAGLPYTLVFHEAPHRVRACVADLESTLGGERRICIAREITKVHESIHCCALCEAGDWLAADPHRCLGEFVLIVAGAQPAARTATEEAQRTLAVLLGVLPLKAAVATAVKLTGGARNELYDLALAMKQKA